MGGKDPRFLVPGDVRGEGPKAVGNPSGRQDTRSLFKIRVVIREEPGRTPGVSPSTGSGQRGEVPP